MNSIATVARVAVKQLNKNQSQSADQQIDQHYQQELPQ